MIYGPNSGGKTALIDAILLFLQSTDSENGDLVYNGELVNLINYKHCAFNDSPITIGLSEWVYWQVIACIEGVRSFYFLHPSGIIYLIVYNNDSPKLYISLYNDKLYTNNYIDIDKVIKNAYKVYHRTKNFEEGISELRELLDKGKATKVENRDEIISIPYASTDLILYKNDSTFHVNFEYFEYTIWDFIPRINDINYLGPIRYEYENRLLPIRHNNTSSRGEDLIIESLNDPKIENRVNICLSLLDINYNFCLNKYTNNITGSYVYPVFKCTKTNKSYHISDLGYGIRQVLPILMIASKHKDSINQPESYTKINIINQPELHLHPKMQGDLLDIIINYNHKSKSILDNIQDSCINNQWILETHSEAMLYRLQRRIREGVFKSEDVAILYVEPLEDGSSTVHHLRMDEKGYFIDEWPGNFFEQQFDDLFGG